MHPYPGNWVAIGRAVVYCARSAQALSAGIKCQHCSILPSPLAHSLLILIPTRIPILTYLIHTCTLHTFFDSQKLILSPFHFSKPFRKIRSTPPTIRTTNNRYTPMRDCARQQLFRLFCKKKYFNPSNAKVTFFQSTRMQINFEEPSRPCRARCTVLVFIG